MNRKELHARTIKRGLAAQCPGCGHSGIFNHWWSIKENCPECGLKLKRADGFFLGAMVWNYGFVVFGILPLVALLVLVGLFPPMFGMVVAGVLGLLGPFAFYPYAWSLWLMTFFIMEPEDLEGLEQGDTK